MWASHGVSLPQPPTRPHLLCGSGERPCPHSLRKGEVEVIYPGSSSALCGDGRDTQAGETKFMAAVKALLSRW